jgi:hypothetical protein
MSVTESATAPAEPAVRRLTTARAMVEGIAQEMERDPGVVVLGEDVANADFRTGTPALGSGEFEAELASVPPGDCGVGGEAGVAQDG